MSLPKLVFTLMLVLVAQVALATPEFTLYDLNGKPHRLSDYHGKWVVVNYWATWCPPCQEEIPELIHFYDTHKSKAVVLGVDMDMGGISQQKLRRFVSNYMISYPVLKGTPDMETIGPVPGLLTTYVIAPDGRPVARQIGEITSDVLTDFIKNYDSHTQK